MSGTNHNHLAKAITEYEASSSWWIRYVSCRWAQRLAGKYLAWKVSRKLRRWKRDIEVRRLLKELDGE